MKLQKLIIKDILNISYIRGNVDNDTFINEIILKIVYL